MSKILTRIDRNRTPLEGGILSVESMKSLRDTIDQWGKVLIYLNRRGAYKSLICQDCGHIEMCPHCGVGLTWHTSPRSRLLCHHCRYEIVTPLQCSKCEGTRLQWVGLGVQELEQYIQRLLPDTPCERLDSDSKNSIDPNKQEGIVYIGTQYILKEIPSILDLIIVLFPENDLTIPKYRAEERVYLQLRYLAQSSKELIVETHSPEAPILRAFFDGNYRDFTTHTLRERKRFNYPPYSSLAYIHISDTQVSRIEDIGAKILNKLQLTHTALWGTWDVKLSSDILYDRSIRFKRWALYSDTILLRADDLQSYLQSIETEVLRNRGVRVEIAGVKIL